MPVKKHPCFVCQSPDSRQGCRVTGTQGCVRYGLPLRRHAFLTVTLQELAATLEQLGCPREKALAMAAQLDKRALQLAGKTGRSYDEALTHLLGLMKQGWAAKEKGL